MTKVKIHEEVVAGLIDQANDALQNRERHRKEEARKAVIRYVAKRRKDQQKRNNSFLCKIKLLSKDTFPEDEMSSYFVEIYMKVWEEDQIDFRSLVPLFYDMNTAPDWWTAADFEFAANLQQIMKAGLDLDKKIRDFLVALDYGCVSASASLISYINNWSSNV